MHKESNRMTVSEDLAAEKIDCAVVRAGQCWLLAIDARPGRLPAQLHGVLPHISWRCADGRIEVVDLGAHEQDRERLVQEIMGDGLIVAELDGASTSLDEASHWVLQTPGVVAERHRGRE